MAAPDDRPRWARIVWVGVMLELVGLATFWWWRSRTDMEPSAWFTSLAVLCIAASVGVWRRVAWGRFLHGVVSVLLALAAAGSLIPDLDDPYPSGRPLIHWLGGLPTLLWWALVVAVTTLPLALAVALGWRRRWFRCARW